VDGTVYVAGRGGKARVDYETGSGSFTETFEEHGKAVLRTSFDSEGRVLDRRLLKKGSARAMAAEFAEGLGGEVLTGEYADVEIKKGCPRCAGGLRLHVAEGDIPIMPVYVCRNCGARSLDLTDEYLSALVRENRALFESSELEEMERSPGTFSSELRDYIIKIYASKHILKIK
jgi:hypothetical protein